MRVNFIGRLSNAHFKHVLSVLINWISQSVHLLDPLYVSFHVNLVVGYLIYYGNLILAVSCRFLGVGVNFGLVFKRLIREVLLVNKSVRQATTFIVTGSIFLRTIIDRSSKQSYVSFIKSFSHCVDIGIIIVSFYNNAYSVLAKATQHAVVRVEMLFIARVGWPHVTMVNHLLGFFLTEHELRRSKQSTQSDFAKLLFLQELSNVHAHPQLTVALSYLANKFEATTSEKLAKGSPGDSVSRTQFGFDLEVKWLRKHFSFEFGREVKHVHDDVNFSFHFLPKKNHDVDRYIPGKG